MDRLQLLEALNLSTFIAFDFETTGLSADNDRLIEIAAIRFVNGQAQDRFVTLVNPGVEISPLIADITGITNTMVKDAPAEETVVDEFLKFLGSAPLVAHNIPFDWAFLKALRQRYGKPDIAHDLYDTLQLSRVFLFFRPAHNLGSVAEFFNLNADDAHRAESDTENCGQVFLSLIAEAASYPLGVVTKLLEILKHVDVHNKAFYVNLANALTRTGDLKNGLVKSTIEKPVNDNLYIHRGSRDLVDFSVREVFGPDGVLKKTLANFEYRSQQLEYAEFVDQALGDNRIAVVEAGTGLGKTQAYLYPSIKRTFNKEDQGPTVISCHTKHLQDQLFYKDLPMLAEALDLSLQAVMLKGRNNYICRTRLGWVIADAGRNLNPLEAESLLPLVIWLEWTRTGDLSECTGFWSFRQNRIAAMIRSEPGFCTSPLCARHQGCFFGPLRRNTFSARVIVVNHALLLAETRNPGVLPPFSSVVIDEAHNLVSAAYGQFTLAVDQNLITGLIQRIDLDSAGAVRLKNRLTELAKLHSGLERPLADLLHDTARAHSANRAFFDEYTAQVGSRFRVDSPYTEKHLIESLAEEFSAVDQELKALELALKELVLTLQKIERELNKIDADQNDYSDLIQVFEQARQQFGELLENLASLTRRQQDDWVYWQEGYYRTYGRKQPELTLNLCAAPVDVSGALVDSLFAALDSAVLTSATLRIDDSFEYFLHRTGLDRPELTNVVTTDIASPFYYQDQVKYFQLGGAQNGSKDPVFIAELIYQCHKHYGKRMMVLFTSWAMLNGCYNALRQKPEGRSLPIYAQRATTSRYALIKGMSETPNGILLGTDAFWEGIDLPGELLEILIITKLPFAVPSEPLIKAYSDLLNRQGRNSFLEFSVPEAVIKFRQGFGRLIRSTTDEGIFIVLDERIVAKRYGSYFRDVIPTPMSVFQSVHELLF